MGGGRCHPPQATRSVKAWEIPATVNANASESGVDSCEVHASEAREEAGVAVMS